jgi:hypothetical protein
VAVWGGVEIILSVCNFVFTWFLFHKLRRTNEERDFLYRRDMGELYARYQVCILCFQLKFYSCFIERVFCADLRAVLW